MHTSVVVQNATGTTYYGFNHKNNFNLLSTIPKKGKKVVFLSSVHSANSMREATRKGKTDVYYKRPKVELTVMIRNVPCLLQLENKSLASAGFLQNFR